MKSISLRLSTGSSSSELSTGPDQSLGGKMANSVSGASRYDIPQNSFIEGVLFDDISASENLAEIPEYRCVFIYNNPSVSGAKTVINPKIYISGSTYAKFELGKALTKNIDATLITTETQIPSLISFDTNDKDNKLALGVDLAPGDRYAIWIKRTPKNVGGAGSTLESLTLIVEGSQ